MKLRLIALCLMLLLATTSCVPIDNTQPVELAEDDPLKPFVEYLSEHAVAMETLCEQELEYTHFSDYRVILMGETHGVQKTYNAELILLRYLYEAYDVRHILIEYGYCDGMLLNEYLQNGDEAILKEMLKNLRGTAGYSNENYVFYTQLYAYNAELVADRKLHISGVDVQHQFQTGIFYLSRLLPKTSPPAEIADQLDAFLTQSTYSKQAFGKLTESIEAHGPLYATYLGEDVYSKFLRGIKSIQQGLEYSVTNSNEYRESCIIDNCTEALESHPNEKTYGIFGSTHTGLSVTQQNGEPMLANYLNSHYEKTMGKVASITCVYYNSKRRDRKGVFAIDADFPVISYAAPLMPDDISFCPLDFEGSPFAAEGEGSLDSQQYLAIIRNSDAASAYKARN